MRARVAHPVTLHARRRTLLKQRSSLLALSYHTKQQDRGVIVQWLDRRLAPARGLENDISSFEWALRL
jgi:hypothetical protein